MKRRRIKLVTALLLAGAAATVFAVTRDDEPCCGGGEYVMLAATDPADPVYVLLASEWVDDPTHTVTRRTASIEFPEGREHVPRVARLMCDAGRFRPPLSASLEDGELRDPGPEAAFDRVVKPGAHSGSIDCVLEGRGWRVELTNCGGDADADQAGPCADHPRDRPHLCTITEREDEPPGFSCRKNPEWDEPERDVAPAPAARE